MRLTNRSKNEALPIDETDVDTAKMHDLISPYGSGGFKVPDIDTTYDHLNLSELSDRRSRLLDTPDDNGITHLTVDGVNPVTSSVEVVPDAPSDVSEEIIDENYAGPVEHTNLHSPRLAKLPNQPAEAAPKIEDSEAERSLSLGGLKRFIRSARSLPASFTTVLLTMKLANQPEEQVQDDRFVEPQLDNQVRPQYEESNQVEESEQKKSKRLLKVAAGIGVVGVAAAVSVATYYAATRGIHFSGATSSHHHEALKQVLPAKAPQPHETVQSLGTHINSAASAKHAAPHEVKTHAAGRTAERVAAVASKTSLKVKYVKERLGFQGDSVWNHVRLDLRSKLGHNPSTSMVRKFTGQVLRDNHLSWADAKHMRLGQAIKIRTSLR